MGAFGAGRAAAWGHRAASAHNLLRCAPGAPPAADMWRVDLPTMLIPVLACRNNAVRGGDL